MSFLSRILALFWKPAPAPPPRVHQPRAITRIHSNDIFWEIR